MFLQLRNTTSGLAELDLELLGGRACRFPAEIFAQVLAVQDLGRRNRHGDRAARIRRALVILGMLTLIAFGDGSAASGLPRGPVVTGAHAVTPVPGTAALAPPPGTVAQCSDARDLHAGVLLGCVARLRKLLEMKPEQREVRNAQGQTPLSVAVLRGRSDAAEILLAGGADVNAPIRFAKGMRTDYSGLQRAQRPELAEDSTPLMMARDAAMVALLLRFGADTRTKNNYGWSAIFYYTHHGTPDMLDALLGAGAAIDDTADVDPSHAGSTPLMWAAYMNRGAQLRTLLKYNPRLEIRDRAKKTALDYARQFGHVEPIQLLSAAAASR